MKWHKLAGTRGSSGYELKTDFTTMIHRSGYFYARAEGQSISPDESTKTYSFVPQIQTYIRPFTAQMLTQRPLEPNHTLVYEFLGNCIGHVRVGSDNADGAWSVWNLSRVKILVDRFADGISIKFEIATDSGAQTYLGAIDSKTICTLAPFDYWFEVFAPLGILHDFLRGEWEDWIDPEDQAMKFVEELGKAGLHTFQDSSQEREA